MKKIETIIFDLGGVLVDWNPRYLYRKIFDSEEEMETFLGEICTMEWNAEQDAGRTFAEATQLLVDQYPDYEPQIRAYFDRWEEMFSDNIEGSIKVLEELIAHPDYGVYALTNWSAETWPIALRKFPFFKWFEGVLVSGEENMKKPDLRIYRLICERFNLNIEKCLFFDDSPKNIVGAREAGMQAFQFLSPEQLREELAGYGVRL